MRRLIDSLRKKSEFTSDIVEKRIYERGVVGIRPLLSNNYMYSREREIRSSSYSTYRYRMYEIDQVDIPKSQHNHTIYERNIYMKNFMRGIDLGSTMRVTFSTTVYPDGTRRDGGSICFILTRRPDVDSITLLISSVLSVATGIDNNDILSKIIAMRNVARKWRIDIPSFSRLQWKNVSMETMSKSVIVAPHSGDDVLYFLSPSGTFILNDNMIMPVNLNISSTLTILMGRYNDITFYPYDIAVRDDISVEPYPYSERMDMVKSYNIDTVTSLSTPKTATDFFSFVIGKEELLFYHEGERYIWKGRETVRVFVSEGGIPLSLTDDTLQPVKVNVNRPMSYIGDMIDVARSGDVVRVLPYSPSPMKMSRINDIMSSEYISADSLSGRNCDLYTKYVERVTSLLYLFYQSRGVRSVLDVSNGVDHSYWTLGSMSTYTLARKSSSDVQLGGVSDGDSIVGDTWEVEFIEDIADVPIVDATDIFKMEVSVDNLDIYTTLASKYISFISSETDHRSRSQLLIDWGWQLDTTYKLDKEELLPVDEKCREDLQLTVWSKRKDSPEVVRLIYTPLGVGMTGTLDSPYGSLTRTGTLGATTSGRDDSLIHALMTSNSIEYRRADKVAKTLYALRNRDRLRISVPIYLIPKDSWKMYQVTKTGALVFDQRTERRKGIVIFINKGHWEPLAKRNIDGSLNYIW